MATVAISSGCFGFSNRLAADVAATAKDELGVPIGVEIVVPRWGVPHSVVQVASSVHHSIQIGRDEGKLGEKLYWDVLYGSATNPSYVVGKPVVVHAPSMAGIIARLGRDEFVRRFGNTGIWLENVESLDRYKDPIHSAIEARRLLAENNINAGFCYDVGHAAMYSVATDRWNGTYGFIDAVLMPDLSRLGDSNVRAAHFHNFDPHGAGTKLDHKPLRDGAINIDDVVAVLVDRCPNIQLTLEVDYYPAGHVAKLGGRILGLGFHEAMGVAISDLRLLCRAALLID